jgi:hypothetical protein
MPPEASRARQVNEGKHVGEACENEDKILRDRNSET